MPDGFINPRKTKVLSIILKTMNTIIALINSKAENTDNEKEATY